MFIQWAFLFGFNGAIQPSMQAHFQPLPWLHVDQKLALSANSKYSSNIGKLNMLVGFDVKGVAIDFGHKSEIDSEKKLQHMQFMEISYKKEF
jgi:hypothetical protein